MKTETDELIQRYVAAVVRGVPEQQRADVAAELTASIADAVDDRVAAGSDTGSAITEVVTELGDPNTLAAQYGGRGRFLVGPDYYNEYVMLLRTLLMIIVPIVLVAVGIAGVIGDDGPISILLSAVGTVFQVGVQLAFWITVVFVILERTQTPVRDAPWSPDDLPEVVDRRIGFGETVFSVVFTFIFMWAIWYQRDHWLISGDDGSQVPFLDPAAWDFWLPALYVTLLASIVLDVAKYRTGKWTYPLAAFNTVVNAASATVVLGMWFTDSFINPAAQIPDGVLVVLGFIPWIVVLPILDSASSWWNAYKVHQADAMDFAAA